MSLRVWSVLVALSASFSRGRTYGRSTGQPQQPLEASTSWILRVSWGGGVQVINNTIFWCFFLGNSGEKNLIFLGLPSVDPVTGIPSSTPTGEEDEDGRHEELDQKHSKELAAIAI